MDEIHELLTNNSQGSIPATRGKKGKGKFNNKGQQVFVNPIDAA